jgi:hypothetical protein
MAELGGRALYLSPAEVGLGERESAADVGRVLSRMVHGIVARVFSHADEVFPLHPTHQWRRWRRPSAYYRRPRQNARRRSTTGAPNPASIARVTSVTLTIPSGRVPCTIPES